MANAKQENAAAAIPRMRRKFPATLESERCSFSLLGFAICDPRSSVEVVAGRSVPYTRIPSHRGSRTDAEQRSAEIRAVVARGGWPAGPARRRGVSAKH